MKLSWLRMDYENVRLGQIVTKTFKEIRANRKVKFIYMLIDQIYLSIVYLKVFYYIVDHQN